ncbi:hypothetical protein Clacol_000235 [Clathrus columnatus]|uniref:AB hydrolase-1 domain-containing protein n=1 Tax=Clathrus columnatus TaxID=1419009 RepID=A0AAV4ZWE4_9AGAM|nr:hypothetical protein Clacol_000235 [Clathrus columnatus]
MSSNFIQETLVFENACHIQPLKFVATCHSTPNSSADSDGFTLIFVHATGTHKETWNPVIQSISRNLAGVSIRAMWTFDLPNHGDSAELNREVLKTHISTIPDFARSVVTLVNSAYLKGHRIILVGHSVGASVCMYSTKLFSQNNIPYEAIILVEPPMIDRDIFMANIDDRNKQINAIVKGILKQKSFWDNRELARQWLIKRFSWNQWDNQSLELFLQYGLKDVKQGVAIKCAREQEVASYTDVEATFEALSQIAATCQAFPIHVIFGSKIDLVPKYSQDSVIDSSKGRQLASVTRIPRGGHMVVQEQPTSVGKSILEIVKKAKAQSSDHRSKL